jgi:S1-C subfamily serine protease
VYIRQSPYDAGAPTQHQPEPDVTLIFASLCLLGVGIFFATRSVLAVTGPLSEPLALATISPMPTPKAHDLPAHPAPVLTPHATSRPRAIPGAGLYTQLAHTVVRVEAGDLQGSAVALTETSLVTNVHVVTDLDGVIVVIEHPRREIPAKVVKRCENTDLAVLEVPPGSGLVPIRGARTLNGLRPGEHVYSYGFPHGLSALGDGRVVGTSNRYRETANVTIEATAPADHGSSGGGLFDERGYLLGITTLINHRNASFSIPVDSIDCALGVL